MPDSNTNVSLAVDHLFRSSAGQMVSYLTRVLGPKHLDLAEEVVQDALVKALQTWSFTGIPENPRAWLLRVARNRALDVLRHRSVVLKKGAEVLAELSATVPAHDAGVPEVLRDDELRMIFLACNPALSRDARVALSLKAVSGFSVNEIARAFLAEPATISQRILRAKRQIEEDNLEFKLPSREDLAASLDSVLEVIYLLFNEGYAAHSGEDLIRRELCAEALRLARLVADSPVSSPKANALVSLLAFQAARLDARTDAAGEMVLLEDQDRKRWDSRLVAMGLHYLSRSAAGSELSEYHLQAAIAATHAQATDPANTNWEAILALYDDLLELNPSPIVALNRVVAIGKVQGPEQALSELARLPQDAIPDYYLLPSIRGSLLAQLGRFAEAARQFESALACPCSGPERRFLQRRRDECQSHSVFRDS
jgi:RNA polymerase sigma-70 factor, ECF subfamily